jgi:hypothetical protein
VVEQKGTHLAPYVWQARDAFAGPNYYVRILSTLNRELLKPSSSVALHRHSNALVDILPPEADSSIAMLSDNERPDVTYQDIGGNDIQKQEIREAVELPLSNPDLYAQVRCRRCCQLVDGMCRHELACLAKALHRVEVCEAP